MYIEKVCIGSRRLSWQGSPVPGGVYGVGVDKGDEWVCIGG